MAMTPGTSADVNTLPGCRLRRVTEYIEQNLDKELRLAELAALAYMSPYHFARLFKCSTGVPPHRFVVRQRIARASVFLATPSSPSDSCYEGYADALRRHYGDRRLANKALREYLPLLL